MGGMVCRNWRSLVLTDVGGTLPSHTMELCDWVQCLIMSIILWVCGKESTALVVPTVVVAVGTAGPVYRFHCLSGSPLYVVQLLYGSASECLRLWRMMTM